MITLATLTEKKLLLDSYQPLPESLQQNLQQWFAVELTYTSNALEGNTLTRQETAVVMEKDIAIGGKTLREHLEAKNHAKALRQIEAWLSPPIAILNEYNILQLNGLVLAEIDAINDAGNYRNVTVRVTGSTTIFPNPAKVPVLMREFTDWLQQNRQLHPVELAIEAHYRLVSIHPFVDGNGRTARLLMNLFLQLGGYPPAIIEPIERVAYLTALELAQTGGSQTDFNQLVMQAVDRSLDIYLEALINSN